MPRKRKYTRLGRRKPMNREVDTSCESSSSSETGAGDLASVELSVPTEDYSQVRFIILQMFLSFNCFI